MFLDGGNIRGSLQKPYWGCKDLNFHFLSAESEKGFPFNKSLYLYPHFYLAMPPTHSQGIP